MTSRRNHKETHEEEIISKEEFLDVLNRLVKIEKNGRKRLKLKKQKDKEEKRSAYC